MMPDDRISRGDFHPDLPGANVDLSPGKAPVWMATLLDSIQAGRFSSGMNTGELHHATESDAVRRAAVLMLFSGAGMSVELPNDAAVLLTHRSPRMRSHPGQIAFPGGRIDPTDVNAVDCALREAWEETGLDRRTLTPVAELEEVHIRASGYPVHPVLGHWHSPSPVAAVSPQEADEVFEVPLLELIDPDNRIMVRWGQWQGPAFKVNGYVVWGFTGGLLSAVLKHAGWAQPWDRDTTVDLQIALAASRNNERPK